MSGIVAVLNRDGRPVVHALIQRMIAAAPFRGPDGARIYTDGAAGLAYQRFRMTSEESDEEQPLSAGSRPVFLVCDARLDNRPDLARALELERDTGRRASDAALILGAYERWGPDCTSRLLGDFAFAIWDAGRRQLYLARDALGVRGLACYHDDRVFLAASEIGQLLAHPAVPRRLNETKVARYLVGLWDAPEETFYQHIRYLPPAHCLLVSQEGIRQWRYWDVDPTARLRYHDDGDYAAHFRELLTEAVRARLRGAEDVGISLSGGLDSTVLAAIAAPLLSGTRTSGQRLKSYSYVFDRLTTCDERRYIEPVAERCDLDATYLNGDEEWTLREWADWPSSPDFVFSDAYVRLPLLVRRAARAAGCRLLLTGHYADALFAGGQFWFLAMFADGRQREALRWLAHPRPSLAWRAGVIRSAAQEVAPPGLRRAYRRLRPEAAQQRHPGIARDLVSRVDPQRLRPDCAGAQRFSAPGQWSCYYGLMDGTYPQEQAAFRSVDNGFGLEAINPYQDRRLVEFAMAVPADQLAKPGWSKWVLRNAVRDLLPAEVVQRRTKTNFYPLFEMGLRAKETAMVETFMRDPQIVQRGWIRDDWLRAELHPGAEWADEGYPLWLCISLERWLRDYW